MKRCNRCQTDKELSKFHKNKNNKDGLNYRCIDCTLEYNRERYKNKAPGLIKWQKEYYSRNSRKIKLKKYGLTEELYTKMLKEQNYQCRICGLSPSYNLYVDHDHKTGLVRGLLCLQCNAGLGNFRDNTQLLQRAIKYLMPR